MVVAVVIFVGVAVAGDAVMSHLFLPVSSTAVAHSKI